MIELLDRAELILYSYRNIAMFFFSTVGFIWASIKIWLSVAKSIGDKANLSQRHKFQAGYFDTQELRYDRQEAKYDKVIILINGIKDDFCEFEKKALKSEISRLNSLYPPI